MSKNIYQAPHNTLLEWFDRNKRDLPFRKTRDPYHIWVSEIMLQQTRVAAMTGKFSAFIERFPDIASLSLSSEDEVFQYWSGLGYYSRAKNLRSGAIFLMENYGGYFPSDKNEVLKIPGIGSYTAAAVLSIAFDAKEAVLDGNVKRVLSRLFEFEEDISDHKSVTRLQALADGFLNHEFPGNHNQALMELGATVCFVKPDCTSCPLASFCRARKSGKETTLPLKKAKSKPVPVGLNFLLISADNKLLLVRDKGRRFFKTIYSPPYRIICDDCRYSDPAYIGIIHAQASGNLPGRVLKGEAAHSITHHKITLSATEITASSEFIPGGVEFKWVDRKNLASEFPSSVALKLEKIIMNQNE